MQVSQKLKDELKKQTNAVFTHKVLINDMNIKNLIKDDFSDFTAYQGATVTKNITFPIDVFKGGRNLLLSNKINLPNEPNTSELYAKSWAGNIYKTTDLSEILIEGNTYTLSYDMELIELPSTPSYFSYNCGINIYSRTRPDLTVSTITTTMRNVGDTHRVECTFTIEEFVDQRLLMYTQRNTTNGVAPFDFGLVKFSNIKLEKGSTPTPYAPAPEDGYGYTGSDGAYHIETSGGTSELKYLTEPLNVFALGEEVSVHTRYHTFGHALNILVNRTNLPNKIIDENTSYNYFHSGEMTIDNARIQYQLRGKYAAHSLDFIASEPMIYTGDKPKLQTYENLVNAPIESLSMLTNPIGALPIGKLEFTLGLVDTKQTFNENGNYEVSVLSEYVFDDLTSETFSTKKYYVDEITYDQATGRTNFTALDKINKLNVDYKPININYPTTFGSWVSKFSNDFGLDINIDELFNKDYVIKVEPYFDNLSVKQVLQKVLQHALSFGFIDDGNNFKIVRVKSLSSDNYIDTVDRTIRSYKANPDYFKSKGINTLVLGLQSDIPDENVSKSDQTMISIDGPVELRLDDLPFAFDEQSKREVIDNMFDEIKGFKHKSYEMENPYFYFDLGDVIQQEVADNGDIYNIPILSYTRTYNGDIKVSHEAISESISQTENQWKKFTPRKRTEIKVDKLDQRISLEVERTDDLEEKYAGMEIDLESLELKVGTLNGNANIIPYLNGSEDLIYDDKGQAFYPMWTFIQDGLLPATDLYPGNDVYPSGPNSPIFWQEKVKGTLSEYSLTFDTKGTAISPEGYVVPDEVYSYRGKRINGNQRFRLWIREYKDRDVSYNATHTRKLLLDTTSPKLYEVSTTSLDPTTQSIRLEFEILDNNILTLSDQMFNRGNPKDFVESVGDVKLYAKSKFEVMDNQIKSTVEEIKVVDGKTVTNRSLIQQNSDNILLKADKIELAGMVKFTDLSTAGNTIINGNNITTGTISANRLNLTGYAKFTDLSTGGATTINGSNITTGTIQANRINFNGATGNNVTLSGKLTTNDLTATGGKISIFGFDDDALWSDNIRINKYGYYFDNGGGMLGKGSYGETQEIHLQSRFVKVGNGNLETSNGILCPYMDGGASLGTASIRWWSLFLKQQPNVSSDTRYKYNIHDIDPLLIKHIGENVSPKSYKLEDDKWHFGYIAQDVERALYKFNLEVHGHDRAVEEVKKFAVLSKDESYMSLLYGEINVILDAYNRLENDKLRNKINDLEERLLKLEGMK